MLYNPFREVISSTSVTRLMFNRLGTPTVSAGADIDSSTYWFDLDELIRCNRPEGVKYRDLLQQATAQIKRAGESVPFAKTGWYDDGRVQSWVFVFGRVAGSTALPDLGDANPPTSPASHPNRAGV